MNVKCTAVADGSYTLTEDVAEPTVVITFQSETTGLFVEGKKYYIDFTPKA